MSTDAPTTRELRPPGISVFTKILVGAVLFLILAGSMVTSTGSGLAVPDWPLSFGGLFPPMVGGIFFEHGHRMVATAVGLLVVILVWWLIRRESRRWLRGTGLAALGAILLQGLLGGLTVLFFLPTPISVGHAMLAQTFLLLVVLVAYAESAEWQARARLDPSTPSSVQVGDHAQESATSAGRGVVRVWLLLLGAVYLQLDLGAVMRHSEAGLALLDWPSNAGALVPAFDDQMLQEINDRRFMRDLPDVAMSQVIRHFSHRIGAIIAVIAAAFVNVVTWSPVRRARMQAHRLTATVLFVDALILAQVVLGGLTVLTGRVAWIASLHVLVGAGTLAVALLGLLRAAPIALGRRRDEGNAGDNRPAVEAVRGQRHVGIGG